MVKKIDKEKKEIELFEKEESKEFDVMTVGFRNSGTSFITGDEYSKGIYMTISPWTLTPSGGKQTVIGSGHSIDLKGFSRKNEKKILEAFDLVAEKAEEILRAYKSNDKETVLKIAKEIADKL